MSVYSIMPPNKDHERFLLKIAQFNLLSKDKKFDEKKDIEFIFQELNINTEVPDTNYLDKYDNNDIIGDSLLHLAFKEKNLILYNILLCKGANFNLKDKEGNSVLHRAFHNFCYCHISDCVTNFETVSEKFIVPTLSAHVKYRNTSNPSDSNGLTHFHIACARNDTEAVEFFLRNGVQVNEAVQCVSSRDYFRGYTPLHFAAEFGCAQVTEVLLKYGANAILEDDKGQTPLHVAVGRNIRLIHCELCNDVEINEQVINLLMNHSCSSEFSSLFVVSALKDSYQAESFLARGVDVNQSISLHSQIWPGYTALHFAARVNVDTVKLLLRHGANIEAQEADGYTPIEMCNDRFKVEEFLEIISLVPHWKDIVLSDGKTKLVHLLGVFKSLDEISSFLRESKDNAKLFVPLESPFWPGLTVLHIAVLFTERKNCKTDYKREENGTTKYFDPDLSIIIECLKQGSDVTAQKNCSWTPIHMAFRLKKKQTLDLLLQYHHRIQNSVDKSNLSHLHIACRAKDEDLVEKLLWNGADANIVYQGNETIYNVHPGWTPLHIAVYKRHYEIIKLLLQFGADLHAADSQGHTPIHVMMRWLSWEEFGKILLDVPNLRDIVVEDLELSYLHVASAMNNVDAVKRLLDLGADINKSIVCTKITDDYPRVFDYEDCNGSTPLHLAVNNTDVENFSERSRLLSLLIERGADILAKNANDVSPLCDILQHERHHKFIDVIIEALQRNVHLQQRVERETGVTLLHLATCRVRVDLVEELLNDGANVNAQIHVNSRVWPGCTPMHVLVRRKKVWSSYSTKYHKNDVDDVIAMLLERNADVTLTDGQGDTPLHVIYRKFSFDRGVSNLKNVIRLLKSQKNFVVNPTSVEGISHFHIACHMLELDVVENFLEHDIDVNMKVDVFYDSKVAATTPLHLTLRSARDLLMDDETNPFPEFARLKIADLLIKNGADVSAEDVFANTPAHHTAARECLTESLFRLLAKSGANVNARNVRGEAPLEVLLNQENVTYHEIQCFITCGCRFNAFNTVTEKGYIALACDSIGLQNMLHLLFETFINFPDLMKMDESKRTALHNLVSIDPSDTEEIIELINVLTMHGCDIDSQDDLGRTALHLAAQFRNDLAVAELLLAGADVNITDHSGRTPFAYAFEPPVRSSNGKDQDHDPYSDVELFETFMGHIKKMEYCNIYVNRSNEVLLNEALERFGPDSFARDLINIITEVQRLEEIKIEPFTLSAADFLTVAVIDYPLMSLAKRKAIDAFFRANMRPFLLEFKLSAGMLQSQYRQALLRRKIIDEAIGSLRVLARCRLPDICSHIILRSLENFELQNLIACTVEIES